MDVLVLGGTRFVGRHVVERLLADGHAVSVLNRGLSQDALPAGVERLRGDRDAGRAGLAALAHRRWHACVDVSGYTPRQVGASTDALRERVDRYVYVSAVSVYGDPPRGPVTEAEPLLAPASDAVETIDAASYGPLKVACEQHVQACFAGRAALLRPQVVVGPHDASNRYVHWVQRARRGGAMLAPGDGSDALQVIDVRDLAGFVASVLQRGLDGAYNLAGPRLAWADFIALLGVAEPVWVPAAILQRAGLDHVQLPLYRRAGSPRASLMDVSPARALAAGLRLTAPADTLRAVQAACRDAAATLALPPELEAELIRQARARHTG